MKRFQRLSLSSVFLICVGFMSLGTSCSKDKSPSPLIPDRIVSYTYQESDTAGVGQLVDLKLILATNSGDAPAKYNWSCSSGEIKGEGANATWIPASTGNHTVKLQCISANTTTESQITIKVVKTDFRCARWNDSWDYIMRNEKYYGNTDISPSGDQFNVKIASLMPSGSWFDKYMKKGEKVYYKFRQGKLVMAGISWRADEVKPFSDELANANYYFKYFDYKNELSQYGEQVEEERLWVAHQYRDTSVYKAKPEWWGAAVSFGMLMLKTEYRNSEVGFAFSVNAIQGLEMFAVPVFLLSLYKY